MGLNLKIIFYVSCFPSKPIEIWYSITKMADLF
jgi:hypothetical protein